MATAAIVDSNSPTTAAAMNAVARLRMSHLYRRRIFTTAPSRTLSSSATPVNS